MTTFPRSPRLVKGGIVLLDPDTGQVRRVITLQYNPETLSRSFQVQGVPADGGDRSEALRLKGPPVETIKVEAELDATDQLEFPEENRQQTETGILAQLAALETIVYPSSQRLLENQRMASGGTLVIIPAESALTLFVWSRNRVLPVRITDLSVTEEAFDTQLHPIRAKVSLGMRVLTVNDVGFQHKGGSIYMTHQQGLERLAAAARSPALQDLGIGGIP